MPKTVFADGTEVTPAFLNAVNNPTFVTTPNNDGEIAKLPDAALSDAADQLKTTAYTYFDQLEVSEGSSGLQLAYNGGLVLLGDDTAVTVASANINAIDDSTSYVFVNDAGTVQVAASLPIRCLPMAEVVASAGTISTISDLRPRWQVLPRPEEIALNTDESVAILQAPIAQGRLTLAGADPLPTNDITGAATLYYHPYNGNAISLWNGGASRWDLYEFTRRELDISGLAADTNFDIFLYDNSGTLTLEAVAWDNSGAGTSSRTTAGAIAQRNGIWVKDSDDRRYLGTIRTTNAGECEDSQQKRFVWNVQNQERRILLKQMTGIGFYDYQSASWRAANGDSTQRVDCVTGLSQVISLYSGRLMYGQDSGGSAGIGWNRSNDNDSQIYSNKVASARDEHSLTFLSGVFAPDPGYHQFHMVEYGIDAAVGRLSSFLFVGEAAANTGISGIIGEWSC